MRTAPQGKGASQPDYQLADRRQAVAAIQAALASLSAVKTSLTVAAANAGNETGRPGPNLESSPLSTIYNMEVVRIFYTAFGLSDARADYYLERPEPLAWALAAAMKPVRFSREELTAAALRRIGRAELPPESRNLLSAFVHATTRLRTSLEERAAGFGAPV